jgi:hypothetical protein
MQLARFTNMKETPKKEETPSEPTSPPQNDSLNPKLLAKQIKLTPEGINQADIDAVNKRLTQMRKRLKADILFIGGKFAKMRDKIPHGRWGRYIEHNFDLSIKTANIWIRAWENRDCELAVNDWAAYMRALYGNEPKKLKADYVAPSATHSKEDDDDEQSGGEGFSEGLGEPTIFADKGKTGFFGLKQLTALLDTRSETGVHHRTN